MWNLVNLRILKSSKKSLIWSGSILFKKYLRCIFAFAIRIITGGLIKTHDCMRNMQLKSAVTFLLIIPIFVPCSFADNSNSSLQNLGMQYFLGLGREKNIDKAKTFLMAAAEDGDGIAMFNLSGLFLSLNDFPNAAHWMVSAIMSGDKFAFEQMMRYEYSYPLKFREAFKLKLRNIVTNDITTNGVFDYQVKKIVSELFSTGLKNQRK